MAQPTPIARRVNPMFANSFTTIESIYLLPTNDAIQAPTPKLIIVKPPNNTNISTNITFILFYHTIIYKELVRLPRFKL
jgi:hypothetical protein